MLDKSKIQEPLLIKDLGMLYANSNSKQKRRYGIFKCECGKEFKAQIANIKSKHTVSCGCMTHENSKKHGQRGHEIYHVWKNIKSRCLNPKNKAYINYGARGISICNRWLDINNFIEDMYPTYIKGLSIDRINNDGNYEPSNCRWTNRTVQQRNTRKLQKNNKTGYRGVYKVKNKFSARIGVNYKHIHLGYFFTKEEAAKAYDKYVKDNNLEHTVNFPKEIF